MPEQTADRQQQTASERELEALRKIARYVGIFQAMLGMFFVLGYVDPRREELALEVWEGEGGAPTL